MSKILFFRCAFNRGVGPDPMGLGPNISSELTGVLGSGFAEETLVPAESLELSAPNHAAGRARGRRDNDSAKTRPPLSPLTHCL